MGCFRGGLRLVGLLSLALCELLCVGCCVGSFALSISHAPPQTRSFRTASFLFLVIIQGELQLVVIDAEEECI